MAYKLEDIPKLVVVEVYKLADSSVAVIGVDSFEVADNLVDIPN